MWDVGTGEPILFLHGLGSRKEAWKPQLVLSDAYRLLIPDLRGHGNSTETDISMESFVNDILGILDSKGIDKVNLCGLSMGGVIARRFASQHSDRLKSLILSNTFAYAPLPMLMFEVSQREMLLSSSSEGDYIDSTIKHCVYNLDVRESAREAFYVNRETYKDSSMSVVESCSNLIESYTQLRNISVPTLVISSDKDEVTPWFLSLMMYNIIPNCERTHLTDTGHLSNFDNPEGFNHAVRDFLSKVIERG